MTQPKRPIGVNAVSAEDIRNLIAENDELKMRLAFAERKDKSATTAMRESEVNWMSVVLWRSETPTAAGALIAILVTCALVWCASFVVSGFTAATIRGAVMVVLAAFAWWLVFVKKRA